MIFIIGLHTTWQWCVRLIGIAATSDPESESSPKSHKKVRENKRFLIIYVKPVMRATI